MITASNHIIYSILTRLSGMSAAVIFAVKIEHFFSGCFDPVCIFLLNKNSYFFGVKHSIFIGDVITQNHGPAGEAQTGPSPQ